MKTAGSAVCSFSGPYNPAVNCSQIHCTMFAYLTLPSRLSHFYTLYRTQELLRGVGRERGRGTRAAPTPVG